MKVRFDGATPILGAPDELHDTAGIERPWVTPDAPLQGSKDRSRSYASDGVTARRARGLARRDVTTVRRAMRGELSAFDALSTVAWSGGFPIRLEDGRFLFAAPADGPDLAVATSHDGWVAHPMRRQGSLQIVELELPEAHTVRYRFISANGGGSADPWARRFNYDERGEYSLTRSPGAHLERWPNLYGDGVSAREVHVWVPPGEVTHQIYVHDGQNLFDPHAMHGGWRLQHTAGAHTMVVGIDNRENRFEDLTFNQDEALGAVRGGNGARYYRYVQEVVRAHVERNYGRAGRTGVMGSSLGGLASLEIVAQYPDAFDFVASLSGTVGWGSGLDAAQETVKTRLLRSLPPHTVVYLDSGGNPGGADNYDVTRDLADTLASAGLPWNDRLFHWHEPGAPHREHAWANRVHRPLRLFEGL